MNFSIITPCYNSIRSIKKTVGSVRGQCGVNFEHIIQDGNSSDGTLEWLQTQDDLLVKSETDSGMYQAINRGWERATGDILSWLNSDEQYLPDTLSRVEKIFKDNPAIDIVWGNYICINSDGDALAARRDIPARLLYLSNSTCYIASCTVFFRRHLWDKGDLRLDESLRVSSDKDLYIRLLKKRYTFYLINEYLSLFEVSTYNLSGTLQAQVEYEDSFLYEKYGSFRHPLLLFIVKGMRYFEKFAAKSYFPTVVKYDFALDETPTYQKKKSRRITNKFSFPEV